MDWGLFSYFRFSVSAGCFTIAWVSRAVSWVKLGRAAWGLFYHRPGTSVLGRREERGGNGERGKGRCLRSLWFGSGYVRFISKFRFHQALNPAPFRQRAM